MGKNILYILLLFSLQTMALQTFANPSFFTGQTITIKVGPLLDEANQPVVGVEVVLRDLTDNQLIGEGVTDQNGLLSLTYKIPSTTSSGPHVIEARSKPKPYYEEASIRIEIEVIEPAKLTLQVQSPSTVKVNEEFKCKVKVANVGGAGVTDAKLKLKVPRGFKSTSEEKLGTINPGETRDLIVRVIAPNETGSYTLKFRVEGLDEATNSKVKAEEEKEIKVIGFPAKGNGKGNISEGLNVEIEAPLTVFEGETINVEIKVCNIGDLKISDLKVKAQANNFIKSFNGMKSLDPDECTETLFTFKPLKPGVLIVKVKAEGESSTGRVLEAENHVTIYVKAVKPPKIIETWVKPGNIKPNQTITIYARVIQGTYPLAKVTNSLTGQMERKGEEWVSRVKAPGKEGKHSYTVEAIDTHGNKDERKGFFEVKLGVKEETNPLTSPPIEEVEKGGDTGEENNKTIKTEIKGIEIKGEEKNILSTLKEILKGKTALLTALLILVLLPLILRRKRKEEKGEESRITPAFKEEEP